MRSPEWAAPHLSTYFGGACGRRWELSPRPGAWCASVYRAPPLVILCVWSPPPVGDVACDVCCPWPMVHLYRYVLIVVVVVVICLPAGILFLHIFSWGMVHRPLRSTGCSWHFQPYAAGKGCLQAFRRARNEPCTSTSRGPMRVRVQAPNHRVSAPPGVISEVVHVHRSHTRAPCAFARASSSPGAGSSTDPIVVAEE